MVTSRQIIRAQAAKKAAARRSSSQQNSTTQGDDNKQIIIKSDPRQTAQAHAKLIHRLLDRLCDLETNNEFSATGLSTSTLLELNSLTDVSRNLGHVQSRQTATKRLQGNIQNVLPDTLSNVRNSGTYNPAQSITGNLIAIASALTSVRTATVPELTPKYLVETLLGMQPKAKQVRERQARELTKPLSRESWFFYQRNPREQLRILERLSIPRTEPGSTKGAASYKLFIQQCVAPLHGPDSSLRVYRNNLINPPLLYTPSPEKCPEDVVMPDYVKRQQENLLLPEVDFYYRLTTNFSHVCNQLTNLMGKDIAGFLFRDANENLVHGAEDLSADDKISLFKEYCAESLVAAINGSLNYDDLEKRFPSRETHVVLHDFENQGSVEQRKKLLELVNCFVKENVFFFANLFERGLEKRANLYNGSENYLQQEVFYDRSSPFNSVGERAHAVMRSWQDLRHNGYHTMLTESEQAICKFLMHGADTTRAGEFLPRDTEHLLEIQNIWNNLERH